MFSLALIIQYGSIACRDSVEGNYTSCNQQTPIYDLQAVPNASPVVAIKFSPTVTWVVYNVFM